MTFSPLYTDEIEDELMKEREGAKDLEEKGEYLQQLNNEYFADSANLGAEVEEIDSPDEYRQAPVGQISEVIVNKHEETELTESIGVTVDRTEVVIGGEDEYRLVLVNEENYKRAEFEFASAPSEVNDDLDRVETFLDDLSVDNTIESDLAV